MEQDLRKAFMAGATRHTNWESFVSSNEFVASDYESLRKAFMAGANRHTNWERFQKEHNYGCKG